MQQSSTSLESMLSNLKIKELNAMQQAAAEAITAHDSVILLSDTGSGKTLAFLVPLIGLMKKDQQGTQAMVIVPSRELAIQIEQVFKKLSTGFKVTCCYGGHLRETEENNLVEAPALIIGTAGRLADHLRRGNITVNNIKTLVLDEFDKTVELGFQEDMSFIIGTLTALEKRVLTSATEALEIPDYIGLKDAVKLDFLSGQQAEALEIKQLHSDENDKAETVFRFICSVGNRSTIIFCNHRESVERLSLILKDKGIVNAFYHGALEQPERDSTLCKFRNGTVNVLVTTDLAARGLDIPNIRYIVHYHLPGSQDIFTHRNGRTARMDKSGTAVLVLGPDEQLPDYVDAGIETIQLPEEIILPEKPKWATLFIAAGKKDKVNKVDIVGFLTNRGQLKKDDIGLIEVKDFFSFVAIRKASMNNTLHMIKDHKIKNKKVKIDIAR